MLRLLNDTIPLAAVRIVVPDRTAPLAPVPTVIDRLTEAVDEVTVLP